MDAVIHDRDAQKHDKHYTQWFHPVTEYITGHQPRIKSVEFLPISLVRKSTAWFAVDEYKANTSLIAFAR